MNEHFKGRQALVCTQIDGKKGYVHNHILINDVSMIDLKGCVKEQYYYKNIEIWTDEITQEYTILDLGEKNAEEKAENIILSAYIVFFVFNGTFKHTFINKQKCCPCVTERIKSSAFYQSLQKSFINFVCRHSSAKIFKAFKLSEIVFAIS